jgi:poly(3-hydroxyoctanoate) depolymerase
VTPRPRPLVHGETRLVDVDGHRLRVSVAGDGPPLLLLNGFGVSIELWNPLREALPGVRTIAFDPPGAGASSIPPLPVRIRGLAHLATRLLDELGCATADVLGVSMGGAVAQELAHRAPGRVRRAVLCATSCGIGALPGNPLALALLANPMRNYSRRYARWAAPHMLGGRLRTSATAARTYVALRLPVLVLSGDDDPIVPVRNARLLASRIPDARLEMIRGGGHLFLLDSLDVAAPLIRGFLGSER